MNGYRLIWRSLWTSGEFSRLPMPTRLLFIGMITVADDQGRLQNNPALLRAAIFPYDDLGIDQMEAWIRALGDSSMLLAYVSPSGQELIQIVNWWWYQRHQFASPSSFPPPDGWMDRIRFRSSKRILTYNWQKRSGERVQDTCDERGIPLDKQGLFQAGQVGQVSSRARSSRLEVDLGIPSEDAHAYARARGSTEQVSGQVSGQVGQVSTRQGEQVSGEMVLEDSPVVPQPAVEPYKGKVSRRPAATKKRKVTGFGDPRKFKRGKIRKGEGTTPVEVYYEFYSVDEYRERLNDIQMEAIDNQVTDLDKFRETVKAWKLEGNKPANANGLLAWYAAGHRNNLQAASARNGRKRAYQTANERGVVSDEYSREMEQVFQ